MTEGESAVPNVPLGEFSTGGCVDEREAILLLGVLEDVRKDRLLDDWNGGPRRLVDGGGGHGKTQWYSEHRVTMSAIGVMRPANNRGYGCSAGKSSR